MTYFEDTTPLICTGELREEEWSVDSISLDEIRTRHLPDASQTLYRHTRCWLGKYSNITFVSDECTNDNKCMLSVFQKTRYSTEEELPPPPSPPQLKEVSSLDGVPRPTSTERILAETAAQHVILRDGHQQVATASLSLWFPALKRVLSRRMFMACYTE